MNAPADGTFSASAVKGVFLFNFASFVRWPDAAFANRNADLVYCTMGRDDVVAVLPGILAGETVDGHRLSLRAVDDPGQLAGCHVVYLADGADSTLAPMLQRRGRHPVLTVSSTTGFATRGGHIELEVSDRRVRPRINAAAVADSGLSVSAQLYRLATVVDTDTAR
ncbi:MAG: YfiR family protein [Gammaproteobacteria bacterium]|nr:YfiR family protein [Gammaproteobacteria bacterium]